jgi:hypothetical protein
MVSTIVGVLLERHLDRIVLANGTQIFLEEGVAADVLPVGATLTILCTAQGHKKLAHYISVNPDWLLDCVEALAAGPDSPATLADLEGDRSEDQALSPRSRARRDRRTSGRISPQTQ